jgi:excinuclease ABC subunit C
VTPELEATLKRLPDRPGVYLLKDARGDVLYVGKAQSLRHRVRSYWQKQKPAMGEGHRIRSVIDRIADVEVTEVDSVSEALLLENNLIKRFKPRFNVRLKDDKSYPYIKVTLADDFPRVERTRKLVNDGSRYFGPYASATSVDESMNLVRRLFPFRTCTIDITTASAPSSDRACCTTSSGARVRASRPSRRPTTAPTSSRSSCSSRAVRRRSSRRSARDAVGVRPQDYERAAGHRDKIRAIERTMESQKMAAFARTELDLAGMARQDNQAAVTLFIIRDGKMIGRDVYLLDAAREASDAEVLTSFLEQYYTRADRRSRVRSTSRRRSRTRRAPDLPRREARRSGASAYAAARREA